MGWCVLAGKVVCILQVLYAKSYWGFEGVYIDITIRSYPNTRVNTNEVKNKNSKNYKNYKIYKTTKLIKTKQ